ncbi:16S rRNA (guanine(966)-N(2))-methyltransferase RsmD [Acidovorax sp. HDW3]|jgi:16S rRNA (guanine(966)-N(2))-methyltransferase RsmD|uniref:16S rRNA (guanine(966)-N(2))-methyltransferase RsmD n=1 Tax=Acidovorax sp. HDW3 TaxID=2714923 RepID=UPI00140D552C|nr:16S rRNA (guanine(966)-N(2))-methyltransferase RsmD [Acidovorax sp. HDW3]MCE1251216.1 16S rRNA (guanine(966)-N(2))-methyltransferase RsmD [Comamonadaceae bacterium]QIL43241.1 16S rRNA (guanine(966)-N(2))-methyltransferase RsmD [Acidovorax sp. HDW3]
MSRPPAKAAPARPAAHRGAGEVRIIGGQWKRQRLTVPERPGLRPTPDRVRETLFNWLGQDLTGWRCLDAFAGTGALGLEAASRGAAEVLLVEQDAGLATSLQQQRERLQAANVRVQRGDGLAALQRSPAASLHLVLLDPPFGQAALFAPALAAAVPALAADGFIYLEAPQRWDDAALAAQGLQLYRHLKAGAVHAHLLQRLPLAI